MFTYMIYTYLHVSTSPVRGLENAQASRIEEGRRDEGTKGRRDEVGGCFTPPKLEVFRGFARKTIDFSGKIYGKSMFS